MKNNFVGLLVCLLLFYILFYCEFIGIDHKCSAIISKIIIMLILLFVP